MTPTLRQDLIAVLAACFANAGSLDCFCRDACGVRLGAITAARTNDLTLLLPLLVDWATAHPPALAQLVAALTQRPSAQPAVWQVRGGLARAGLIPVVAYPPRGGQR